MVQSSHFVQFFGTDAALARSVSNFFVEALRADRTCIMVGTAHHRAQVAEQLRAHGIGLGPLVRDKRYLVADAATVLQRFCTNGQVDHRAFEESVGSMVTDALALGRPVSIYGEMVGILADEGHSHAVIELERMWNELGKRIAFTLFCGYMVPSGVGSDTWVNVCGEHEDVVAA
ncbi:MAG TPA: MEDS domain-containing protein [Steroidobacteraceae bacterium]|nr:MEDS domain-containing protein [Steroidobacteraceae bacterium]